MPRYQPKESPGFYKDHYDLTAHIGPMCPELTEVAQWPMYSFDRPSTMLWNAIATKLHAGGWTDEQIKVWLQSKSTRWALDGTLGDRIAKLGDEYADEILKGEQS